SEFMTPLRPMRRAAWEEAGFVWIGGCRDSKGPQPWARVHPPRPRATLAPDLLLRPPNVGTGRTDELEKRHPGHGPRIGPDPWCGDAQPLRTAARRQLGIGTMPQTTGGCDGSSAHLAEEEGRDVQRGLPRILAHQARSDRGRWVPEPPVL